MHTEFTRRTLDRMLSGLVYAVLLALLLIILSVVHMSAAEAHSWYDKECCSGKDCAEVVAMNTGPNGRAQFTNALGKVAEFNEKTMVRRSKDSKYHACIVGVQLRCLYTPWVGMVDKPWPGYKPGRPVQ